MIIQPPIAQQILHNTKIHDITLQDNYHWLRDTDWPTVDKPEIIDYLKAENEYTEQVLLSPTKDLRASLFNELKSRIKLSDQSTYIKKDNYYYYQRTEENQQYTVYCRKFGTLDAQEEIILDHNKLAQGKKYSSLGTLSISPDHRLLAYTIDEDGSERYKIKIVNLETQEYLPDEIPSVLGDVIWHKKLAGFFYTPITDNWRRDRVLFHQLGSEEDRLILQEYDPIYSVGIDQSSSRDYLFISSDRPGVNEVHFLTMDGNFLPTMLTSREQEAVFAVDHHSQYFYVLTNDAGSNFRLMKADITNHAKEQWEELIPMSADRYLSGFDLTSKYLLINYRVNGLPIAEVRTIDNLEQKELSFDDEVYEANVYSTNFEENDIRVSYSSLRRPDIVYAYDFIQNKLEVLKETTILGDFNPDNYVTKRLWAENRGVKVPISLVYKKSTFKHDGSNPLYLRGYGSYGIRYPARFSRNILSLLDRGFVYAIAHIRGGDELGYSWYEDGKQLNKKNTFHDFIAVTEYLKNENYAREIVISGGSAGGMLIGTVLNLRPELYKAAIADVPFVDVLNTMLDETLPLTPGEYKEFGNPKEPEFFIYMASYSPYDNVKAQDYPHLLVTAGISDPRVGYWEPAKWAAKLRNLKTDNNLLLLKTAFDSGHRGASGRFDYLHEITQEYAFIFKVFGLE